MGLGILETQKIIKAYFGIIQIQMNRIPMYIAFGFLAAGILSVSYSFYLNSQKVEVIEQYQQPVLPKDNQPFVLKTVSKITGCKVNGSLPDPDCTPGAIFQEATKEKICVPGYTKTVRSVSTELKKQIYEDYGISYPQPSGTYEVDHFIPLALGGSNDFANLWPEAEKPTPGFKEKDIVEVYLYEEVCAGKMDLSLAQQKIVSDWVLVYNNLDSGIINELKNKYQNWSN